MHDLSIIIVNWNGKKWLEKCISSILSQSYSNFEIIFVDNASTDGSIEYLNEHFPDPRIKIVKSPTNLGFAGGNNLGITYSSGEYVILLNNDTWMEKDFLKQYIAGYEKSSVDILGVTETAYGNSIRNRISYPKIDPLGHMIYVESVSSHFCITDLFYTSGVCILFTRKMYDKTGGLDNDFFMYFEEIDWIWRARLYGYTIGQLRDIFIHHAGSGSTGSGIKYNAFLWRNQNTLQMLLKNYRWYNLFWNLPVYILQNIVEIFFFLIILKPKIAWSYVEGWIFNIRFLKRTLKKRYLIQSNRCVSEIEILKKMYFGLAKWKHLITFFSRHE